MIKPSPLQGRGLGAGPFDGKCTAYVLAPRHLSPALSPVRGKGGAFLRLVVVHLGKLGIDDVLAACLAPGSGTVRGG